MKTALAVFIFALAMSSIPADAQNSASADELLVVVQHGLYGYIDHAGKFVIQPQFLWAEDFENGYGTVYVCGRYALIDKTGNVLPFKPHWGPGLTGKKINGKIGFVDSTGVLQIKPVFDETLPFSDGAAAVKVGDVWGFIDTSGRYIIPPRFDGA